MIIGTTLHVGDEGNETYYTPWVNAQGNLATMVLDVLNIWNASILVTVQTKTEEESDNAADDGGREWPMTAAATGLGPTPWDAGKNLSEGTTPGLLQLIRFKVVIAKIDVAFPVGYVHFNINNTSWQMH